MADSSAYVLTTLARNWWALILRGFIAVVFGLIAWFWPGLALYTLIVLFSVTVIAGGLLSIVAAIRSISEKERWLTLAAEGAIGVGAGLVALIWPDLAAKTFLYIIAIWAILSGVLEIIAAVRLRREISNEWFLGLTGLASILFGIIAIARPLSGALAVLWLIGIGSIFIGAFLILLGWRLRALNQVASVSAGSRSGVGSKLPEHSQPSRQAPAVARGGATSSSARDSAEANASTHGADTDGADPAASPVETRPGAADEPQRATDTRPSRRERVLQELVDSLPPEGDGWVKGDGTTHAPPSYPLKGNANSRIYHAPGGQSYDETIAEICFATDQDAVNAGFRPRQEPEGYGSRSAAATAGSQDTPPEASGDSDEGDLDVAAMDTRLDPVGVDSDGTLETLDIVDDTSTMEQAGENADEATDIEVTDGAAAAWMSVDSSDESVSPDSLAFEDTDDAHGAASPHEPDPTIAEMDYDDQLVIEDAGEVSGDDTHARETEDPESDSGEPEAVSPDEVAPDGTVDSGAGGSADDEELAYSSIDEEIEAAFEAALEEGVSPGGVVEQADAAAEVDGHDESERMPGIHRNEAPEIAQDDEAFVVDEDVVESAAAEPLEPAATLVDASGESVATAIDPEHPTGFGNSQAEAVEQDADELSTEAAETSQPPLLPPESDERTVGSERRDSSEENDDPVDAAGVDIHKSGQTGQHADSKEQEIYGELSASLSAEGDRWMRGLGGHETPAGFPVKGNASSRLYHMPGGRSYAVTIPEVCFATPDDAKVAGFRPRSGDPTDLDTSQIRDVEIPASMGIRSGTPASIGDETHDGGADQGSEQAQEGPGWIRNDGAKDCPSDFPVKGNASSRIYHVPTGGSYEATIPEFCFDSPEAAEAAGFRAARN
jgi:uncharacterized membrane protein HdeD (DUF308 family)